MSHLSNKTPIDMFKIGILLLSIKPIDLDKFCQKLWNFVKQAKEADSKLILPPEISYTPIITATNDNILNATSFLEKEIKKIAKHYSLYSVLYSPIDNGFTSNGIVVQSRHNQEHLLFASVDLKQLYELRQNCSTRVRCMTTKALVKGKYSSNIV